MYRAVLQQQQQQQSGYFDQRTVDKVRLFFFPSTEEGQGCEEATFLSISLTLTAGSPAGIVSQHCWDSRQPWGSPQLQAPGGWGRSSCGLAAQHTDSGSGEGDCACSFSVSWKCGEEGTIW